MFRFKNIIYVLFIVLIPTGVILRYLDHTGGVNLIFLGFIYFLIHYIIYLIKRYKVINSRYVLIQIILIVLMSFSLATKYLLYPFGDIPSLIIITAFISNTIFYLFKEKNKILKLTIVSYVYLLLTAPVIASDFHYSPRKLIPIQWYNRYDVDKGRPANLPYSFKYLETEQLIRKAYDFENEGLYYESIEVYNKARKLEPRNPKILFDLAAPYARINDLETAITLLDTAIMIDSSNSSFYNNRGLLYYKLRVNDKAINDYLKAISLDSNKTMLYSNLALAYYYDKQFTESCLMIDKAIDKGLKIKDYEMLRWIRKRHCK